MFKKYAQALYQSFYSPEIYREAIIDWKGFGAKYLMTLSLLLAAVLTIQFVVMLQFFSNNEVPRIVKQIPEMTIDEGQIFMDAPQPVIIHGKSKKLNIIIDTTKTKQQLTDMKPVIGIGKDFIIVKTKNGPYEPYDLEKIFKQKFHVTQERVMLMWHKTLPVLRGLAFPLLFLGTFFDLIVEALIIAFLSYIVTAFMPEEYDFITRMRIAVLALTPAQIISTILRSGFGHNVQSWFVLLLACLYIYVMIVLIRKLPPTEPQVSITV